MLTSQTKLQPKETCILSICLSSSHLLLLLHAMTSSTDWLLAMFCFWRPSLRLTLSRAQLEFGKILRQACSRGIDSGSKCNPSKYIMVLIRMSKLRTWHHNRWFFVVVVPTLFKKRTGFVLGQPQKCGLFWPRAYLGKYNDEGCAYSNELISFCLPKPRAEKSQ